MRKSNYKPPIPTDLLRREYESGLTQVEIAAKYGVGKMRIYTAMKKFGIPTRKTGKRDRNGKANPNYRGKDVCYGTLHDRVKKGKG